MKQILLGLALVVGTFVPSASGAAPLPSAKNPLPSGPTPQANLPKTGGSKAGTHSGVMKSMLVGKDGDIREIMLRISGSSRNEVIKGCGAPSGGHPLLNWAFTEKRLVYITVDASGCFVNVLISR